MAKDPTPRDADDKMSESERSHELFEKIERSIGPLIAEKQRGQVVERIQAIVSKEVFRGPIPHPRHLAEYEEISPGAADRIIQMAEKVNNHNITTMEKQQQIEASDRRLGMWLGFGALIAFVVGAVLLGLMGHEVLAGLFLGGGLITGVVGRFVFGRNHVNVD